MIKKKMKTIQIETADYRCRITIGTLQYIVHICRCSCRSVKERGAYLLCNLESSREFKEALKKKRNTFNSLYSLTVVTTPSVILWET